MPVTDTHKLYDKRLPDWLLVRDCVAGSSAIKARADSGASTTTTTGRGNAMSSLAGTRYLPPPNADDFSEENQQRYAAYRKRASFANFTGNTRDGFLGMVFRQALALNLPTQVEYLTDNATGGGLSLSQLAQDAVGDTLQTGRYGLLTDYPTAPENLTVEQVRRLGLQANILPYVAESIINWRTAVVDGVRRLSLVVLCEPVEVVQDDGFGVVCEKQYRVLMMIEGVYHQQVFNKDSVPITQAITPRKFDGSLWAVIPFQFIGTNNNDETPDKACLYDIAEVNIAHYRNSADFEESSFMVGQPTPWAAGLTQAWVDKAMKGGVMIGSRAVVVLPVGGSFGIAQAEPNQMPSKGMEAKEGQLVKIGANIIRDTSGDMRVDQVKIVHAGRTSKLGTLAGNVQDALTQSVTWALEFMGGEPVDDMVTVNREFFDSRIDPQEILAGVALLDRGLIAKVDVRTRLRKTEWIGATRTDEDIDGELEGESPIE
jgi:hypothetical protein